MMTYRRGITSIILALIMVVFLTSSIGIMFRRLTINERISQQNIIAQQAFQAAYSGIEHWQYQLRTADSNNEGKQDIPEKPSTYPTTDVWRCSNSSANEENVEDCSSNSGYRVICQTCGPSSSRDGASGGTSNDNLLSVGQKAYKGNEVTRAIKVKL